MTVPAHPHRLTGRPASSQPRGAQHWLVRQSHRQAGSGPWLAAWGAASAGIAAAYKWPSSEGFREHCLFQPTASSFQAMTLTSEQMNEPHGRTGALYWDLCGQIAGTERNKAVQLLNTVCACLLTWRLPCGRACAATSCTHTVYRAFLAFGCILIYSAPCQGRPVGAGAAALLNAVMCHGNAVPQAHCAPLPHQLDQALQLMHCTRSPPLNSRQWYTRHSQSQQPLVHRGGLQRPQEAPLTSRWGPPARRT